MAQKFVNAIEMSQKDRRESVKSIKIRYFSDMTDKEKKEFLSKLQRLGT
nr:MAG TPA_asm: Subtilisin-like serine protease [Caudoviricetes sp.]